MRHRLLSLQRPLNLPVLKFQPALIAAAALIFTFFVVLDRDSESSASAALTTPNYTQMQSREIDSLSTPRFSDSLAEADYYANDFLSATVQRTAQFIDPTEHATIFGSVSQRRFAFAAQTANRPAKPSSSIALERARIDVSDGAIAAVLLLRRAGSTREPAAVQWRTVMGSAKPGDDYQSVSSGVARFADNQSIRVLYVALMPNHNAPDNRVGNRSFEVELSKPSSGTALGQIRRAVVTIQRRE